MIKKYNFKSRAVLFLLLVFLFRITFLIRMRDSVSYTSLDLYNLIQIGSVSLIFFLLLVRKKIYVTFKNQSINYFIAIFLLGILSGVWSENPIYSSYRALEVYVIFMACLYVLNSFNFDYMLLEKTFLRLLFLVMIFSFIGLLSRRSSISLSLLHNNSYPISASILASYCFGCFLDQELYVKRRKILKRYFLVSVFLLLIGTSFGAYLSFASAVFIVMAFSSKNTKTYINVLLFSFLTLIVALFNIDLLQSLVLINKDVDELAGLNGRLRLWEMYLQMIYEKPFFGWGFDIISRSAVLYTTNTHFFLISILGGMGITGLIVFFIGFFKLIKEVFRYKKKLAPSRLGFIGAFSAAFINGGSKGYIGEHVYPETISFILLLSFFSITYQKLYLNAQK